MGSPVDDYERSFNQYKCQNYLLGKSLIILVRNIASFVILVFLWLRHFIGREYSFESLKTGNKSVFLYESTNIDILPCSLSHNVDIVGLNGPLFFDEKCRDIIKNLWKRYPFSYFFILKNAIKIGRYGYVKLHYAPDRIISSCEYSFTSSVLTCYCEESGIQHINVMHGEKLFNIRDAFCRFSTFYVWDEHYISLFNKLRASESVFIVEQPPAACLENNRTECKKRDYTFYLAVETETTLRRLQEVTRVLEEQGKTFLIRPHPRYTDMAMLKSYFSCAAIEMPQSVEIKESLQETRHAVARFSTVLYQAYNSGVVAVIDDVTDPLRYEVLKEEEYIMLQKTDFRLSQIIVQ